jgi:DNA polymerase I-like protein with 3'-5' exonuclease and polymerase domains
MMSNANVLFFDIETDALKLDDITKIHFIGIGNLQGKVKVFTNLSRAVELLSKADLVVGHNVITFDIPVIQKFYPTFSPAQVYDTLISSKLFETDIYNYDKNVSHIPPKYRGKYTLEAWGYRLGVYKQNTGREENYKVTEENFEQMMEYCAQDVRVTMALWNFLETSGRVPRDALEMEQEVRRIIWIQENFGFLFDEARARELLGRLYDEMVTVNSELQRVFPPKQKTIGYYARDNRNKGIKAGDPKVVTEIFNPSSRDQIAERLQEKYNWDPEIKTPSGKPKVDEEILMTLDFPEAKLISRYLLLEKRISQLAEGAGALLKCIEDDGRIHGKVDTLGTVSRRMSHYSPNIAQVPSPNTEFGKEFRELFVVPPEHKLVGIDAEQLELRLLAHYLYPWDHGEFAKEVSEGDIHERNRVAAGLDTRAQAKTFIYAFVYGAGDETIGKQLGGSKELGKQVRQQFLKNIPALKYLLKAAMTKAENTSQIRTLDGVVISVPKPYLALNRIIQSAGAIVMKRALVILDQQIRDAGLTIGDDVKYTANIHDEFQLEVKEEYAKLVAELAEKSISLAGQYYNLRCPMQGKAQIGNNWYETH